MYRDKNTSLIHSLLYYILFPIRSRKHQEKHSSTDTGKVVSLCQGKRQHHSDAQRVPGEARRSEVGQTVTAQPRLGETAPDRHRETRHRERVRGGGQAKTAQEGPQDAPQVHRERREDTLPSSAQIVPL